MFLVFLIKNICLLSFYFAASAVILTQPVHKSMILVYFASVLCLAVSYAFNKRNENGRLKYMPAAAILLAALYLNTATGILICGFLAAYIFFVARNNEYHAEYYVFKDLFFKLIAASAVLMIISLAVGKFHIFKELSLLYVIVFIISGIYILRALRHSAEVIASKEFAGMNFFVILLAGIICITLGSESVVKSIFYVIGRIYETVFIPIIMGIAYVTSKIIGAIVSFLLMFIKVGNKTEILAQFGEFADMTEQLTQSTQTAGSHWLINTIGYAVVIILMIVLLRWVFKHKSKKMDGEADGISQHRSFLDDDGIKTNKKNKQKLGNNNSKIRYWYKKFLILCQRRKMDIYMSDNSQTVYDKSNEIFTNRENELAIIKEVYRKARYSLEPATVQDVKELKNIYKELENEKIEFKIKV